MSSSGDDRPEQQPVHNYPKAMLKDIANAILKWVADSTRNPLVSVILVILFTWAVLRIRFLPPSPDPRSSWLSWSAFFLSVVTWFIVSVKQWPNMRVDGLPNPQNCFEIHSQQGAFGLIAWFRFLNKSTNTNAILKSYYWLRIGQDPKWHPFNPDPMSMEHWLQARDTNNVCLNLPEAYPPNTAAVRYVVFCGKVPWQRKGDEKPPIWLKAKFEMAEGWPQAATVELKWVPNLPLSLSSFRM